MLNALPQPAKVNPALALASVFSASLHIRLAVPHNLAAELESTQMAAAYHSGVYPPASWEAETRTRAMASLRFLRKVLLKSFLLALLSVAVFAGVAAAFGKVNPALPPDYGKITSAIGGTIAAWAAFLQLSPVERTFRGTTLHEAAYAVAVKVLAVVGVLLAGLGGVWWQ